LNSSASELIGQPVEVLEAKDRIGLQGSGCALA